MRIPNKEFYMVEDYAAREGLNRSQAVLSLIRKGLDLSGERPATSNDLASLKTELQAGFQAMARAIEAQPIAIQESPQPLSLPSPETEELEKVKKMGWWEFWKWKKGSNG